MSGEGEGFADAAKAALRSSVEVVASPSQMQKRIAELEAALLQANTRVAGLTYALRGIIGIAQSASRPDASKLDKSVALGDVRSLAERALAPDYAPDWHKQDQK